MLYRHSLSLETNQYDRRSSDYSWQLLFVCASILIINIPLNPRIHEVGRGVTAFAPGGEGDSYRWGRGQKLGGQ